LVVSWLVVGWLVYFGSFKNHISILHLLYPFNSQFPWSFHIDAAGGLFALNFQFPFSTISRHLAYPSRERDRVLDKILPMQALMPYAPPLEGDKILHHCLLFFQNHIPITIGSNMKQDLVLVLGSWFL